MNHAEYKYVGYKYSLSSIPKIAELGSFGLKDQEEFYQSIYKFNEDVLAYKSLGNLKSDITFHADYLVFDIDSKKLQNAYENMTMLTEHLSIREICFETWFSGHKGFHVMVPTCQFDFEPTNNPDILKSMAIECARNWNVNIDEKIYNVTRVFRMPGSVNKKSGLFKIPITPFMGLDDILELAKAPQENNYPEPDDYPKNDLLLKVYRAIINEPKINRTILPSEEPKKGRSILVRAGEGDRNDALYKMARSLARRGIVEVDALSFCGWWSEGMLEKPIEARELTKTVMSAYTKGMNELVDESNYAAHFFDIQRSLSGAKRMISNLNNTIIRTGYDFMDNYTMGLYKGDVVFIIARPGNYKTCILSSLLQRVAKTTKKKTLMFSMEMGPDRLNLRHMQSAEHMSQLQVVKALKDGHKFTVYQDAFKDVVVIGLSSMSVEMVLGMIDWYLEEKGEIGAIGFDYLSLFRGCASNTENTARVAVELKTRIAKAANCATFCLVQAARRYEGRQGNVEIGREAGKDTSSIEDSGDYILGAWSHNGKIYGRWLKSRAFNSERYYEAPYFEWKINKEQMRLDNMVLLSGDSIPQFQQVSRGGGYD